MQKPKLKQSAKAVKPFRIYAGRKYIRRDGLVVGPVKMSKGISDYSDTHPYWVDSSSISSSYRKDGMAGLGALENTIDLVKEVEPKRRGE